ncbi:hypothetical protein ACHHYP_20583 [Achlya hypogyna]|uniref:Uncharacterized protein n=1 Tax=Achlya hypogyna TaxID=1202772 RepID=A0A1V9YI78_ACHHY|nr:hypothetical protein ACHHYP_20583 [Achlya hypogyna]
MVRFLYKYHHECLATLCRRFAYNQGFTQRRATQATLRQSDMRDQQAQFSHQFSQKEEARRQ